MNIQTRLRRNRYNSSIRSLVANISILPSDLILPVFIVEGENQKQKIAQLDDVYRFSIDEAIAEIKKAKSLGITAFMLFPVIDHSLKDEVGSEAINEDNLICCAIKAIKNAIDDIALISDVALDPYTIHGHDGIIDEKGYVANDETISVLKKQAINQARAGCDIIAPSDMMDGRVDEIRQALDKVGFTHTAIMSYAIKYASNFYGPFRNAVGSDANLKSNKKTYQMDYKNSLDALREAQLDIKEGADMLIVKPAIHYLDIINEVTNNHNIPTFGYHVSGEYQMLKLGAKAGNFDYKLALEESLIAIKRAGASGIITYAAIEYLK